MKKLLTFLFLACSSVAHAQFAITRTNANVVQQTGLIFVTPNIGAATATSVNGLTFTSSTGTLTVANGKTATFSNTLTFTGTDSSSVAFGAGGTVLYSGGALGTPSSGVGTNITGVNAATLGGATFAAPGAIGSGTPSTGAFTTLSLTGAITFPDDVRQTFNPGSNAAGLNVGSIAGDPGTPSNGDLWYDSTANELTARINGANVALGAGGGGTWDSITQTAETDVASATTTDLGAVAARSVRITGTTTITGFGTVASGTMRFGRFSGALTLTHNATSLILPGAANITTVAGDRFTAMSLGSGNWLVYDYVRADGTPLYLGSLTYPTNSGAVTMLDMPVTSASGAGTEQSYAFKVDGNTILKVYAESDGAGGIQNARTEVNGAQQNLPLTVYAAGTAYAFTNSDAAIDFGTTDPNLTITKAGTWLLMGRVYCKYNAATFAANQTLTLKIRRTNNTAADVSNSTHTATLRVITTITDTIGVMPLAPVIYTTVNANDTLALYGSLSAAPAAGSVDATEASLIAIRLY